jgi:amphi-Trp domain-containing protein
MKGDCQVAFKRKKARRDIEKGYPIEQFVVKLRRLADCIEQGKRFMIQVAGERISIPPTAVISVEHERGSSEEELEFQIKWPLKRKTKQ